MRRHSAAVVWSLLAVSFIALMPDLHAAARRRAVNPNNPEVPNPEVPPLQTSFAFIDAALANGSINRDTALLYKVFSTFNDSRLPEQFVGVDAGPTDTLIMVEVAEVFDELSIETQQALAPFFLPPMYAGSWYERVHGFSGPSAFPSIQPLPCSPSIVGWNFLPDPATGAPYPVRFWWANPLDQTKAQSMATEVVQNIWPGIRGVFREPLSDRGSPSPGDCRGGDGRIDVILVDRGDAIGRRLSKDSFGIYIPYQGQQGTGRCPGRSGSVLIDRQLAGDMLKTTLAHELTHVFQNSYPRDAACIDYKWLDEATATWAEDLAYPNINLQAHDQAASFLFRPIYSLNFLDEKFEYGAYVFPYFLSCDDELCTTRNNTGLIRSIYENSERTGSDSLSATDSVLVDGFLSRWPEFTLFKWNKDPFDGYKRSDNLVHQPPPILITDAPSQDMVAELVTLSSRYFYKDKFKPDVRAIAVLNGTKFKLEKKKIRLGVTEFGDVFGLEGSDSPLKERAHVRGLARVNGTWRKTKDDVDWDTARAAIYCQSAKETLDELLVVVSNSEFRKGQPQNIKPPALPMTMLQSNYGCGTWKGTVKYSDLNTTGLSVEWNLTFKHSLPNGPARSFADFNPLNGVKYEVTGTGDWVIAKTDPVSKCTALKTGSVVLDKSSYLVTHNFAVPGGNLDRGWEMKITGPPNMTIPVEFSCPNGILPQIYVIPPFELVRGTLSLFGTPGVVKADGETIKQDFIINEFFGSWHVDLKLQK